MATTDATLVLGYLEQFLYDRIEEKLGTEVKSYLMKYWKRFLDDCFLINNGLLNTHELHSELNNLHSSISFTFNESECEMPLLDILVKKERWRTNNRLILQTNRHT